ncbi:MAG: helix-turn-helix domain-containing protein [Gracilibacteraceae bacterium]|jgi:sugar diacid utilization regulator|nr:helix-turn-helix domain-containing protein [Gracilibacteraceae bacterium]
MRYCDIFNELAAKYGQNVSASIRENRIIVRAQALAGAAAGSYEPAVLYVTDNIALAAASPAPPANLLILAAGSPPADYQPPCDHQLQNNHQLQCDCIYLTADGSVINIIELITTMLEREAYLQKCKSELFECVLFDNYLEVLMDKLFALLKNPVILMDHAHNVVAYRADRQVGNSIWSTIVTLKRHDFDNSDTSELFHRVLNELIQTKKPVFSPMAQDACVMCSVLCADYFWGFIVLIDHYKPITPDDLKLLRWAADVIAVKSEKHEMFGLSHELYYNQIIKDLLTAGIRSENELKIRLISRKWVLKKYKRVLLTSVFAKEPNYIKYVLRRIDSLANDVKSVYFDDYLVIFVEYNDPLKCDVLERIKETAAQLRLIVAVSDEFEDMLTIAQYYRQAQKILNLRDLMGKQSLINYYSDYKFLDFLKNCCEKLEYSEYIHPTALDIQRYDRANNTQYGETLFYYLLNGKSLAKTAAQAHLHKNTVNYRINQIKELFQPYLDDAEETLHLLLSFSLMDMSVKLT